jgi:hypothetical protein
MRKLVKVGAIEREDRKEGTKTRAYISFDPAFLTDPSEFFAQEDSNYGGKRVAIKEKI